MADAGVTDESLLAENFRWLKLHYTVEGKSCDYCVSMHKCLPTDVYLRLHQRRFEFPVVSLDKQVKRMCTSQQHAS